VTTLKQALKTLDPSNDEHWTTGGLPRMEVLEALVGKELTRADVEEVAPDLKRSTAPELKVADPPPADNDHVAEGADQFPVGTGGGGPGAASLGEVQGGGGGGAGRDIGDGKKVGGIEGRVAELEADLAYLRKQFGWPTRSA
jgi:hypothetical protein